MVALFTTSPPSCILHLNDTNRCRVNQSAGVSIEPRAGHPLERDEDEVRRAVAKLGSTVEKVLEESGMSDEELAHLLDLRRPMPK